MDPVDAGDAVIHTPDRRVRVFISSTMGELRAEREAVRAAVESLRLIPVMFELGARPHAPRELYRAYLRQSDVFLGIYGASYGWVAPGEQVSGLEDEYRLAGARPRLLYIRTPSPDREPRLQQLLKEFADDDLASYKRFADPDELGRLVRDDLAVLLSETFEAARRRRTPDDVPPPGASVPVPPTPTLGRTALLERVEEHLGSSRLVTLTGTGGVGKTRVAAEVALRAQRAGREVLYVPLAEVAGTDQMLRVVESAAGGHVTGTSTEFDSVVARVADRPVLLCLDNVEQIDGADRVVSDLLQRLPRLTVLATSRHALRTAAEQEVRVEPLEVPGVDDPDVARAAAVQLFLARARAVDERFALTAGNAADVAEITRRLDGLPLSLELAAARTRILPPRDLLARLDDCFAVLVGGGRDLPDRQRSLRTTLDWSHDLLSPDEQAVFARLSVFAGSWSLPGAEAVCGDGVDAVDALAGLLDKSLVVALELGQSGEPRFGMLQTVRSYAAERLAERGETDVVRDRMLAHVRALGRTAMPSLCGAGQREWLVRLDPELPNLREAVDHALRSGRPAEVVDLVWDVIVHYYVRDAVGEPDAWLTRVQARREELDELTRARLDAVHAGTRAHHGDWTDVRRKLEEPLVVFRREGMAFEAAVTLHTLGFVRFSQDGDPAGAIAALRESSSLFASVGHTWGVSLAEAKLGSVLAATGRREEARAHLATSLEHARRIRCEPEEVQTLIQLALVQIVDGDWSAALATLRDSLAPLHHGHYLADAAMALDAAAAIALHDERSDLAHSAAAAAVRTRDRLGVAPWPTWSGLVDSVHRTAMGTTGSDGGSEDPFAVLDGVLAGIR
ncbi:ATP-binding protein [Blastococcus sp. SYSU D00922]